MDNVLASNRRKLELSLISANVAKRMLADIQRTAGIGMAQDVGQCDSGHRQPAPAVLIVGWTMETKSSAMWNARSRGTMASSGRARLTPLSSPRILPSLIRASTRLACIAGPVYGGPDVEFPDRFLNLFPSFIQITSTA